MQDQNKNNAIFLGLIFLSLLVVFFTVVVLRGYVSWWSAPLPVAAIGYAVYGLIKKAASYKKKMEAKTNEKGGLK